MTNTLYYGDNLPILRAMPSETVDLIYLDPPFNSNRSYNVLFKNESGVSSDAQITAFDDTWHWGRSAEEAYTDLIRMNPGVVDDMVGALRKIIGENQMMAYLVMMAARLVEMQRVLKPKGSLYLHCDPTASHYLKIILDTVFSPENFRNEIVWKRQSAHSDAKNKYSDVTDTILFYVKSNNAYFTPQYGEHDPEYVRKFYRFNDHDGRGPYRMSDIASPNPRPNMMYEWMGFAYPQKGWRFQRATMQKLHDDGRIYYPRNKDGSLDISKRPAVKRYLIEQEGSIITNAWLDINPLHSSDAERLGYPTQKPLTLLERIIRASSNPGDIVLDPFCGCGTAIAAAEKLGRQWIGIDITYLSINLIENRMKRMFPGIRFEVVGKPRDLASARNLAERDRYQFQWWALSLIGAKPLGGTELGGKGKKGSDKGIDGVINYIDSPKQELKRVLVQVKSGHVNAATIRDLRGVLQREEVEIGVLISLEQPTRDMNTEASTAGLYPSEFWGKSFPRVQILTIEQLLAGAMVLMPPETGTFLAAQKARKKEGEQGEMGI
ncbi:MAG: DNA methylase [Chloroflexi bacterium RBG_16_47_49]|nr:MAG: DNA methylase [Chloroflexi bacterium RBG_16_47_49]